MNGDVVTIEQRETSPVSVADTLQTMRVIQQVMESVMKKDVHYGVIPGCKQPSLYKSGSEALLSTFHISAEPIVEEFISRDARGRVIEIRYRVKCVGRHTPTDRIVGYGIGECSTGEDKYAWRRAVCIEEFEEADETLRRVKWSKYQNEKAKKVDQVRVSPADMSNTVLKMAKKRAQIDMTLTTLGCSDIFQQDLEDIDESLRENFTKGDQSGDSALLKKWVDQANAAKDADNLALIWTSGIKEIKAANDMPAYEAFKAAVSTKGEAFKAPKQAQNASIPPELEGLIADMEAAADGGNEAFEKSWNTLSKATQEKLTGEYDRLKARAAKVGESHVPE
jgi:hypothetical protein